MSLVNDALRKARLEAARQEASRAGRTLPSFGRPVSTGGDRWRPSLPLLILALSTVAMTFLVVALVLRGARSESPQAVETVELAADEVVPAPTTREVSTDLEVEDATARRMSREAVPEAAPPRLADEFPASRASFETVTAPSPTQSTPIRSGPRSADTLERRTRATSSDSSNSVTAAEEPTIATAPPTSRASRAREPSASEADDSPPATSDAENVRAPTESAELAAEKMVGAVTAQEPAATELSDPEPGDPLSPGETDSYLREAEIAGVGTYRLDGIAWSADRPFALVNGQVVGPGGVVDGASVAEVGQDRIVLTRNDRRIELRLR